MPQTPKLAFPYPNANTDPPNGPAQIQALAQAVENNLTGQRPTFEGFVSSAQSIANGAWTDIAWSGELYDTNNGHAAGSAIYTIPLAGWWDVVASLGYFTNGTGARGVRLSVNGTPVNHSAVLIPANGTVGTVVSSRPRRLLLAAGDLLRVQGYQGSGASLALLAGADDQSGAVTVVYDRPA